MPYSGLRVSASSTAASSTNCQLDFDHRNALFIVQLQHHLGTARIRASRSLVSIVKGRLTQVIIHTLKGTVIAYVLNKALEVFLLDGNPLNTWKSLCQAADDLHEELRMSGYTTPVFSCACTDATRYV
jgi:hypothetical protein